MTQSDSFFIKEPLPVPAKAREVHLRIVEQLTLIDQYATADCLDPEFISRYNQFLLLFEQYQKAVLENYATRCTCSSSCSNCCFHWVEDVNSYEAAIIADYIYRNMYGSIDEIVAVAKKDLLELERLDQILSERVAHYTDEQIASIDQVDLLLTSFYQLRRPCPLLDKDGNCSIYPVRPLTCRMYLSFSDPSRCAPEYINSEDIPTYLLDVDECANDILDAIHFRYMRFEGDTGLRSLLIKHLGKW